MAQCKQLCFEIPGFGPRKIAADFGGGNVSSDGGVLLLRQVDRWLGLTKQVARALPDYRDPDRITHSLESVLRQRVYGLALGYEDLNDHDLLRSDVVWQTAAEHRLIHVSALQHLLDPLLDSFYFAVRYRMTLDFYLG